MIAAILKVVAGPLIGKLVDLYKSYNQKQITEEALRRDIEKVVLGTFNDVAKTQSEVIVAEMNADGWLQRNWRPIVAICFAAIPLFYGLFMPITVAWFGFAPVRIGDDLLKWIMDVVMVCLGGYIGGRSLEKITDKIMRK